ncbi:hypothetical protein L6452_43531 [Arctium lappa]|uniref:Uncharacterized protein n=1 Tax=Arctium lappa TaxID=4217 RepID=A0ACB8XCU1_ARCLA|nr:hypothetical protein L6452_43531 [Arctium lappa]
MVLRICMIKHLRTLLQHHHLTILYYTILVVKSLMNYRVSKQSVFNGSPEPCPSSSYPSTSTLVITTTEPSSNVNTPVYGNNLQVSGGNDILSVIEDSPVCVCLGYIFSTMDSEYEIVGKCIQGVGMDRIDDCRSSDVDVVGNNPDLAINEEV